VSQQRYQGQQQPVPAVTVREAWKRVSEHVAGAEPAPALIDVRETWEFADGHAQGAINIPLSQLQQRQAEVPRDREVLFICQVGGRSLSAARYMRQQGVERVVNVDGGTDEWKQAGLPTQTGK
jgi:rhodanese-related sulfurtransferase